jgi:hypothetical protein
MMIYFYDANNRYIGCRELKQNESIPINVTIVKPNLTDGQEAYFIDGAWVVTDIVIEPVIITEQPPTIEELAETVAEIATTLNDKGLIP